MLDAVEINKTLSKLIQETAIVQFRLLVWKITDEDDWNVVRHDLNNLREYINDAIDMVENGR